MNITVIYATGRKTPSCTYGIAQMVIGELLDGGTLYEFQLPKDMPHVCTGCRACMDGHEERCGGAAYMEPILSAMERSELLMFCVPTYVFHVPGQVKTLLDHFAYRWMVHRPDLSCMKKQAVIINTAAGGGMRSTVRELADSLNYWGIARTHVISQKVWNYNWTDLPESFRGSVEKKVKRTVRKVKSQETCLKPSMKVRSLFYLYRTLHKGRKMAPIDDDYWWKQGYTVGELWR